MQTTATVAKHPRSEAEGGRMMRGTINGLAIFYPGRHYNKEVSPGATKIQKFYFAGTVTTCPASHEARCRGCRANIDFSRALRSRHFRHPDLGVGTETLRSFSGDYASKQHMFRLLKISIREWIPGDHLPIQDSARFLPAGSENYQFHT